MPEEEDAIHWVRSAADDSQLGPGQGIMIAQVGDEVLIGRPGHVTRYTLPEWEAFRRGIKDGDFDDML